MAWWSTFSRLPHPDTNTIVRKLNDIPIKVTGLCEYTASHSFHTFITPISIYVSNSRFEVKFWVQIDTNSIQYASNVLIAQLGNPYDIHLEVRSSYPVCVTGWKGYGLNMILLHNVCSGSGVTNRDLFCCFVQPWKKLNRRCKSRQEKQTLIRCLSNFLSWWSNVVYIYIDIYRYI